MFSVNLKLNYSLIIDFFKNLLRWIINPIYFFDDFVNEIVSFFYANELAKRSV